MPSSSSSASPRAASSAAASSTSSARPSAARRSARRTLASVGPDSVRSTIRSAYAQRSSRPAESRPAAVGHRPPRSRASPTTHGRSHPGRPVTLRSRGTAESRLAATSTAAVAGLVGCWSARSAGPSGSVVGVDAAGCGRLVRPSAGSAGWPRVGSADWRGIAWVGSADGGCPTAAPAAARTAAPLRGGARRRRGLRGARTAARTAGTAGPTAGPAARTAGPAGRLRGLERRRLLAGAGRPRG